MKKKFYLIVLLALSVNLLSAQPFPGGVSASLKLWLKSNAETSTTGALVDSWGYANNALGFTSTGAARPTLNTNRLNFNPGLAFTGAQFMDGPAGVDAPITVTNDNYTVIAVWQSNTVGAFQRIWTQGNFFDNTAEKFSFATWNDGRYGNELGWAPFDQTIQRAYSVNTWNISQMDLLNTATGDFVLTDDRNISTGSLTLNTDPNPTTPNGALLRTIADIYSRIGNSWTGSGFDTYFNGDLAELIVFDNALTTVQRNSIFSYLAIKYGVTLKTNLVSSSGAIVWDATLNATYNNSVFGVALDNTSGLSVQKSNSIETGDGNGVGQTGEANIVISDPSTLTTDGTFLIIGNDNGAVTEAASADVPTAAAGSLRLAREWKAQVTNSPGTITAALDLTGITVTGTVPANFRLMVDEDGNGDFTDGTVRFYTPTTFASNIALFENVTLNNNETFAFITSAAGAILPVNWKSFTAGLVTGGVALNWVVDNNQDGKTYEIEHSIDGRNFSKAAELQNKKDEQSYKFTYNTTTPGVHYFRIRQVDLDGKFIYSKVVSVLIKGNSAYIIRLLNNPIRNNYAEFEVIAEKPGRAIIELWSSAGAKLASQQQTIGQGTNKVKVPMDRASAGNYILKLQIGDVVVTESVVKF